MRGLTREFNVYRRAGRVLFDAFSMRPQPPDGEGRGPATPEPVVIGYST